MSGSDLSLMNLYDGVTVLSLQVDGAEDVEHQSY